MGDDYGYYSEASNSIVEAPKKEILRVQVPYSLRFAIIWTLFFIIIGVAIQFFEIPGQDLISVLTSFFSSNYADWFRSFGNFVSVQQYDSAMQIFTTIMSHWYYFFFTGGLLSLVWGLISWLINFEIVFTKRDKAPKQLKPIVQKIVVEKPVYDQKQPSEKSKPLMQKEIADWLDEGLFLLSEDKIDAAESIYEQIKRYYDPEQDVNQESYKRILDFYYEIMNKQN